MSVVASVKVYDGIVLGAESQTQLLNQTTGFVKAYSNANKLFAINSIPVGILVYGIGNIGDRSIESYIAEFESSLTQTKEVQVKSVAENLFKFFVDIYEKIYKEIPPPNRPVLGVLVAGYSTGEPVGEEWEFIIPQDKAVRPVRTPADSFGASWRGITVPFTRLYKGFDPNLFVVLKANGVTDEQIQKINDALQPLSLQIPFNGMPLQDAIDFCRFIIQMTIDTSRFVVGVQSCGGPIDIAIITKKEMKFISQKSLN